MFRKQLTTGSKKYFARIFGLSLTLSIVYNVNIYAQNINTATNGLSKNSDTVLLGGTLNLDTDIDLGSFNLGFKKGSTPYFSLMNNGSIRLGKYLNSSSYDSILTTDNNGNLQFLSIADAFGHVNVGDDFGFSAPYGPTIRFMNSPQAIYPLLWMYNDQSHFRMESSNISMTSAEEGGSSAFTLFGGSIKADAWYDNYSIVSSLSTGYGSATLFAQYLNPQSEPHYGYLFLDTGAVRYTFNDEEKFTVIRDGTVRLSRYLNNETEDSLLTTDLAGNLKLKSLGSLFRQYGGIVNEGDGYRLGGELDQTVLTMLGESSFEIKTDDDFRSIRMFREYELREKIIELKNGQSSLWLEGGKIAAEVSDSENGQYSRFSTQGNQNTLSLNLPGRWSSIIQNSSGSVDLSVGADDEILGPTHYNIWRLDTAGAGFHVMDIPKFSIKNDGTLNLPKYLNNVAEDSVLTTDAEGNMKFKSLSEVVPSLSYLNGLTKEGDSVMLGGEFFRDTELHLFDNSFHLKAANGEDSLSMLISRKWGDRGSYHEFNLITGASGDDHTLSFQNDQFSILQNKNNMSSQFITGFNGFNYGFTHTDGTASAIDVTYDWARFITSRNGANGTVLATIQAVTSEANAEDAVKINVVNEDKGNLFTVDSSGFTFTNQNTATFEDTRAMRIGYDGRIVLDKYLNNASGDSVLTTDANGNLRLKYFTASGGAGADSAWAYDSIHIYNRNEGNVGIGTLTPTAKLHTLGSVRFESFKNNLQGDSVLTTDAEGNLRFVYMPYGSSGGGNGTNYTFNNGLLQANGNVSLGGQLEDSVKIDLGGHIFELHDGANKLLNIAPDGNIGIGTAATNFKLSVDGNTTIGNLYDSVGWGRELWFNGYANADPLFISRYNTGVDASELRMNISDDGGSTDKFRVGHYMWNNPAEWVTNFLVQANGQAAIGTSDITGELSIGKQHGIKLSVGNLQWAKTSILYTGNDQANGDYTDLLVPGTNTNNAIMRINQAGNVGIGTLEPDALYRLSVNGKIRAKGLRVQSSGWADFVFEPGYSLMKLPELEKFVKVNKHLPGIPTATEVNAAGYDVGETQVQLLQKIEELTLYIIELNKQVKTLEEKNKKLEAHQAQVDKLQKQMDELRKTILNK